MDDDDADVMADGSKFERVERDAKEEERDFIVQGRSSLTEHLSLHLPKILGCASCEWGRRARKPKRVRQSFCFEITGPGAVETPDWLEMRGSDAYRSAQRVLEGTDDL